MSMTVTTVIILIIPKYDYTIYEWSVLVFYKSILYNTIFKKLWDKTVMKREKRMVEISVHDILR